MCRTQLYQREIETVHSKRTAIDLFMSFVWTVYAAIGPRTTESWLRNYDAAVRTIGTG